MLDSRKGSQVRPQNRKTTILGFRTEFFFFLFKRKFIIVFFFIVFPTLNCDPETIM